MNKQAKLDFERLENKIIANDKKMSNLSKKKIANTTTIDKCKNIVAMSKVLNESIQLFSDAVVILIKKDIYE
jgi:hypothetical protein